jgi:predicted RNA-binding Zn ribbon-like protein
MVVTQDVRDGARRAPSIGAAPGQLELVRAFVNTLDIEAGTDDLAERAGLRRWLAATGLPSPGEVTAADLREAIVVREALRAVLRAHVTGTVETAGLAGLRDVAGRLPIRLAIADDGSPAAVPDGTSVAASLSAILLIAAEAAATGTWQRLKACGADDCQWAFYDRSPTRSGCWCSMAVCGSRAKSRSYRRRAGGARPTRPDGDGTAAGQAAS